MSYSENGNGGWGNGSFFGDGAWWLIILLLFAGNGWGNGFGFGATKNSGEPWGSSSGLSFII